jgi:solute carrier family 35 protein E3
MKSSHSQSIINASWLILNIVAVVGIVMANKLVFTHFQFHFGTLLTVIHFVFTSAGLELGKLVGWIPRKSVEWWRVIPLSVSFCGFVVLTNLSLQYNSVGFYQVSRQQRL